MGPNYKVYILNSNLERITIVKNLVEIDKQGNILRYAKQLSNFGFCRFRLGKNDPLFKQFGNIVRPWKYGVQIVRGTTVVWQGLIVNNPHRKRNYVDVEAKGYLIRYNRIQVKHDLETKPGDGLDNYRTFATGTMAAAVSATFAEAATAAGPSDILAGFTLGTVENPDFPSYFTKADNTPLTGGWTFSTDMKLQFDYRSVFSVWQAFGVYSNCDYEVTNALQFNFKKRIGTKQPGLKFFYGRQGNVLDYDAPLKGERTTNDLMGIASDINGNVLHINQRDETSIGDYGLLQDVQAFLDVKEPNALRVRLREEIRFISTPDSSINFILSEKAYPLGQWDVGDTGTFAINDGIVQVNEERRITAYVVAVHNTGKELITVETSRDRVT
jgi:hypothetical protein